MKPDQKSNFTIYFKMIFDLSYSQNTGGMLDLKVFFVFLHTYRIPGTVFRNNDIKSLKNKKTTLKKVEVFFAGKTH